MAPMPLRFFGDQVLRRVASPVTEITDEIVDLAHRMLVTMELEEGVGLAAPQVGVSLRVFTHALDDLAPPVLINPEIVESRGEWTFQEGCLSIPGLYYDVVRPKELHLRALGLDGEVIDIDADELLARVIQHEQDHLDQVAALEDAIVNQGHRDEEGHVHGEGDENEGVQVIHGAVPHPCVADGISTALDVLPCLVGIVARGPG